MPWCFAVFFAILSIRKFISLFLFGLIYNLRGVLLFLMV